MSDVFVNANHGQCQLSRYFTGAAFQVHLLSVSGVFEVEEDDGVEEMMMEPLEQLKHRLKQLTGAVMSQSTETRGISIADS